VLIQLPINALVPLPGSAKAFTILSPQDLETLLKKSTIELIAVIDQLTFEIDKNNNTQAPSSNLKYMSLLTKHKKLKSEHDSTLMELKALRETCSDIKYRMINKDLIKKRQSSCRKYDN
jgi:NifU-like protein involved in Fe-S cluster formation